MSVPSHDAATVRAAQADAWAELAAVHHDRGGATAELPGVRLSSSGLPHPQWNNGDVHEPSAVDLPAVRAWFTRRGVPWGLRLPAGADWSVGRRLFAKRLMALAPEGFAPAAAVDGLVVRRAGPADLETVLAVDSAAFGSDADETRPWTGPLLTPAAAAVTVVLAELGGEAVGTGYSVRASGWAGMSAFVAGVGVVEHARRRGIGSALTSWLVETGLADGATLVHLNPDSDGAARLYSALGFTELAGFDVYVDL